MNSGYTGFFNPSQNVAIANGQQESAAFQCTGFVLAGINMPAAFTGTALTFEVCDTIDGTFQPLYDSSNTLVSMTVAAGRSYAVNQSYFQGVQFLKIKSNSAEGADRSIICSLRGF